MGLILSSALVTDPGLIRANNEDSAFAGQKLIAVADGIGGAPAGEEASHIVIRTLTQLETTDVGNKPINALREAVDAANIEIRAAALASPERDGMGTTLTAVLLTGEHITVFHVGDSRAYLLREGTLKRLTKDDTYVQTLVDRGLIEEEDVRHHPQRSVITQAVQGQSFEPACAVMPIDVGDRFMICSDGLSDLIPDRSIQEVLEAQTDRDECAERLVKLALQAGAPDNVTVIVADITES